MKIILNPLDCVTEVDIAGLPPGEYTLTVTATNVVGSVSATVQENIAPAAAPGEPQVTA